MSYHSIVMYTVNSFWNKTALLLHSCILLFTIAVSGWGAVTAWPLDVFKIICDDAEIIAVPIPLGCSVSTRMIHSVEQTPVENEYRPLNTLLWFWQERVKSHNAGLPFTAPPYARFVMQDGWIIIEGSRTRLENLYYRVGTEKLGQNSFRIGSAGWKNLYDHLAGKRVQFSMERQSVLLDKTRQPTL